jgi:hypothetical protein
VCTSTLWALPFSGSICHSTKVLRYIVNTYHIVPYYLAYCGLLVFNVIEALQSETKREPMLGKPHGSSIGP